LSALAKWFAGVADEPEAVNDGAVGRQPPDSEPVWGKAGLAWLTKADRLSFPWWLDRLVAVGVASERWNGWYRSDFLDGGRLWRAALDKDRLVLGYGSGLIILSLQDGSQLRIAGPVGFAVGASGTIFTAEPEGSEESQGLWRRDVADGHRVGEPVARFQWPVRGMAVDQSERWLLCRFQQRIRWWHVGNASRSSEVRFEPEYVDDMAFLADSDMAMVVTSPGAVTDRAKINVWRVRLSDGRKDPWSLPLAVLALRPHEWTHGPDGSLYFVGSSDAGERETIYQWMPGREEPPVRVVPAAALQPGPLGDGRTAVDAACAEMQRWWTGLRAASGW
jgi:hypothetical protein